MTTETHIAYTIARSDTLRTLATVVQPVSGIHGQLTKLAAALGCDRDDLVAYHTAKWEVVECETCDPFLRPVDDMADMPF
jgi:hypothetical protein